MTIKKTFAATALALAFSTSVFATSTTDITLSGKLTPAACVPALGNDGKFEFRDFIASEIKNATPENNTVSLGWVDLPFTVLCDNPASFALTVIATPNIDNGTYIPGRVLGVVYVANQVSLLSGLDNSYVGGFTTHFGNFQDESGTNLDTIRSDDSGASWRLTESENRNHRRNVVSFAQPGTLTPKPVKSLSAVLGVNVGIDKVGPKAPSFNDEINFIGSAVVEVIYL